MKEILGFERAKKGIFEGDLDEGELEIGQVSYLMQAIPTVQKAFDNLLTEYKERGWLFGLKCSLWRSSSGGNEKILRGDKRNV